MSMGTTNVLASIGMRVPTEIVVAFADPEGPPGAGKRRVRLHDWMCIEHDHPRWGCEATVV